MARAGVPISPLVLAWALEQGEVSALELAGRLGVEQDEIESWLAGKSSPTQGQFTKLAKELRRPSAIFFMPTPPEASGIPTSLRRAPGLKDHQLKKEEVRFLRWGRRIQQAAAWALNEDGEEPVDLPGIEPGRSPASAAQEARQFLAIPMETQLGWSSVGEALREWRNTLEEAGILVLSFSIGRDNLRGFSAWDDLAPVIGINSAWHPTARIFTIIHELGHLLRRTESACYRFIAPGSPDDPQIERWCEEFAAEFLLPRAFFASYIEQQYGVSTTTRVESVDLARKIANRFKVSTRTTALQLQDLGLAPSGLYGAVVSEFSSFDWNEVRETGGGTPTPQKRLRELGTRATEILLDAEDRGTLSRRDLTDYLEVSLTHLEDLERLLRDRSQS